MTNLEAASFRGEFLGMKIIVLNLLKVVAATQTDPTTYLNDLKNTVTLELEFATESGIQPSQLAHFREAALGIAVQAIEFARKTSEQSQQ